MEVMMAEEEKTISFEMVRTSLSPNTPPIPVDHVGIIRVGKQILLEPGYLDLVEVHHALESLKKGENEASGPIKVRLYITASFLMDRAKLVRLRDSIDEILQG